MKVRQFKQLASLSHVERLRMASEGLHVIGENVARLASEIEKCNEVEASRAAELTRNVCVEEAGKFLALIDAFRVSNPSNGALSAQFGRCSNHLAKLLYARMADYALVDRDELDSALRMHRRSRYLDGPNNIDYIFRNDLISEREDVLYVDLVDIEGSLEWWAPSNEGWAVRPGGSVYLVARILDSGLASVEGLVALSKAWDGFDTGVNSRYDEWAERTRAALSEFPQNIVEGHLSKAASWVADKWSMPMVDSDLREIPVTVEELTAERERRWDDLQRQEYGDDGY